MIRIYENRYGDHWKMRKNRFFMGWSIAMS